MKKGSISRTWTIISVVALTICAAKAWAHPTYSQNRDATNCRACHGDFRATSYISLSDGQNWGNLHNLHRNTMLAGDCNTCHVAASRFPVATNNSAGGVGFSPIGCVGCHGRIEDTNPGAGLRQHHWNAGIAVCANCHADANPANFTPVGEGVLPPYYFTPDANHPNKSTDPCNPNGGENYAGIAEGLDNDGDGLYDANDPDCFPVLLGDMDCDGALTIGDVGPFALALVDPAAYAATFPLCDITLADMNGDMLENGEDIQLFVSAMVGP